MLVVDKPVDNARCGAGGLSEWFGVVEKAGVLVLVCVGAGC